MVMTRTPLARFALSALLGAALTGGGPRLAHAAETISEQDAHAIGVQAYLYFYSLVTMDLTRKQLTNVVKAGGGIYAPMNTFANIPEYPTADMKVVVRPNFDTLYSSAWLDLTKEPMIVSVPDTHGRYYLLPMLDMWTDVFASPGWRTTGTQAGDYAVMPPGWSGSLPAGVVRIDAPTPYVWIIGRTKTDGPADYDAVHKIQAGFKITPLSSWGKAAEPVVGAVDPGIDMKTPPKIAVDTMPAGKFFAYAAEILKLQPPHITDQPILAQMQRIGIERGKSFDIDKVDPAIKAGLETAPEDALKLDGVEGDQPRARRERLVDEHRHDGRLRQLLPEARDRHPVWSRREPAGGRDLSDQPRGRHRQAAGWRQRLCPPFRQGRDAAGERLLVGHAL